MPWLSVLVPSKRPERLATFLASLRGQAHEPDSVEVVVLLDHPQHGVTYADRQTTLYHPPRYPVRMGALVEACYRASRAPWVLLANDDVVVETPSWDRLLWTAAARDDRRLLWPQDGLFGPEMCCFPVASRRVLDAVGFWPQPYHRYKLDDTLLAVYPADRRRFVPEVVFRHLNADVAGAVGHRVANGKVYAVNPMAAQLDTGLWDGETARRVQMATRYVDRFVGSEAS